jgi:UDP-N-acetylmuramate dehydrogenase
VTTRGPVIRRNEVLARHTAYRTGGLCHAFMVVGDEDALKEALALCRKEGWRAVPIGAGTRTVVRDGGWAVAILRLGTGFNRVEREPSGAWWVGAATPAPALLAMTMTSRAGGLLARACTAGSVGASLRLDEGWEEVVEEVVWLDRQQIRRTDYATMKSKKSAIILGARLRLPEVGHAYIHEVETAWRRAAPYPPGSWYHSDEVPSVREALHKASLQRVRLRKVAIPSTAPELVVNLGGGTAADLALLQRCTVERVLRSRGVTLEPKMLWAGRHGQARET